MVKLHIYPIEKNGYKFCPVCKTELNYVGNWFGMMDAYRKGNEGHKYRCPRCGWSYIDIYLYRD
jgi:hypothetical protein